MRLGNNAVAFQVVRFRRKPERVLFAAETGQFDRQVYGRRIDRFAVERRVDPVLRVYPGLKDRDFERELAVFEKAAAVRPFRGLILFVPVFTVFAVIAVIALFTVARSLSLRSRSGATRSDDPCHQQESESS